jgi:hypothetical protein
MSDAMSDEDLEARYKPTVPQVDDGYVHNDVLRVMILFFQVLHRLLRRQPIYSLSGAS